MSTESIDDLREQLDTTTHAQDQAADRIIDRLEAAEARVAELEATSVTDLSSMSEPAQKLREQVREMIQAAQQPRAMADAPRSGARILVLAWGEWSVFRYMNGRWLAMETRTEWCDGDGELDGWLPLPDREESK